MDLYPRDGKFSHAAAFAVVTGRRQPDGSYQHAGLGHRRQPDEAHRRPAVAAPARRGGDAVPRVRPHPPPDPDPGRAGPVLRDEHRERLRRGALADHGALDLERRRCWPASPATTRPASRSPSDLVSRLVAARNLNVGLTTLRQIQFGVLDMELHGPGDDKDIDAIHRRAVEASLLPYHEGTFFPSAFGHLLSGYDAGYYGYLWSEVFGDDMFSRFEEEGVTNRGRGPALPPGDPRDGRLARRRRDAARLPRPRTQQRGLPRASSASPPTEANVRWNLPACGKDSRQVRGYSASLRVSDRSRSTANHVAPTVTATTRGTATARRTLASTASWSTMRSVIDRAHCWMLNV